MPNNEKTSKLIKKTLEDILEKINVEGKIEINSEEENQYQVKIETEETGLLIGRHGETINALQLLLGVIVYKKLGEWIRVILDIADYRKAREENIKQMAERIALEVAETGNPAVLPELTPLERRIVHITLTDHPKVVSESTGEGRDRRLTVKPR